jgi:hypothetical protein
VLDHVVEHARHGLLQATGVGEDDRHAAGVQLDTMRGSDRLLRAAGVRCTLAGPCDGPR